MPWQPQRVSDGKREARRHLALAILIILAVAIGYSMAVPDMERLRIESAAMSKIAKEQRHNGQQVERGLRP
jgi:hypothetical protein